jgi:methionine biosynthesis protein MetW
MKKVFDNRNYFYSKHSLTKRVEFGVIEKIIGKNKKVIDLGCGDGTLIEILQKNSNRCTGIEISRSGVEACKSKKLNVVRGQIDTKLPFNDKSFDVAICNVTIHMVMYPEVLINEMKRISKKQIITFPNFAFILNRFELMFLGRFPKWSLFGYDWYSTGHIHQLSIKDFERFCEKNGIKVIETHHLFPGPVRKIILKNKAIYNILEHFSNIFSVMGVFVTK